MSRDPQRPDVPSIGAASDDEFMRALHRAERMELPSENKMEELAERLGPMMATQSASGVIAWRWVGVVAMAGVFVAGAVSFRRHLDAGEGARRAGEVQASTPVVVDEAAPTPPPPRDEPHDIAAPVVSVDALPAARVPASRSRAALAEPTCAGEIELVERSDARLRTGDAQGALDLAREHAERCPRGAFVQERERIAIEALAELGRASEVRARASSFERRFPASPHVWRIRSLAEGAPE
jgi:hypothetical protein